MFRLFDEETAERVWVCSDLHFGHKRILEFSAVRNEFADGEIEKHDERLVACLNDVVGENGILLCLGDLSLRKESMLKYCGKLIMKDKYLVRGNHDNCSESTYKEVGWKILPMLDYDKVLFSHYPVNPCEMVKYEYRNGEPFQILGWGRYIGNCHGHIHHNIIDDARYFNVSLEAIGMKPVRLVDVVNRFKEIK